MEAFQLQRLYTSVVGDGKVFMKGKYLRFRRKRFWPILDYHPVSQPAWLKKAKKNYNKNCQY
jgi:hypothetical protein